MVREIPQGEGGEKGDAFMPVLFAMCQRSALKAIQARLRPSERSMALLNIHAKSDPEPSDSVSTAVREELLRVGIRVQTARPSGGTDLEWSPQEPKR